MVERPWWPIADARCWLTPGPDWQNWTNNWNRIVPDWSYRNRNWCIRRAVDLGRLLQPPDHMVSMHHDDKCESIRLSNDKEKVAKDDMSQYPKQKWSRSYPLWFEWGMWVASLRPTFQNIVLRATHWRLVYVEWSPCYCPSLQSLYKREELEKILKSNHICGVTHEFHNNHRPDPIPVVWWATRVHLCWLEWTTENWWYNHLVECRSLPLLGKSRCTHSPALHTNDTTPLYRLHRMYSRLRTIEKR